MTRAECEARLEASERVRRQLAEALKERIDYFEAKPSHGPEADARNRGIAWGLDWALAELNKFSDALDREQG